VPVAVNCCEVPAAIVCIAGVTAIEIKCAATTVRVAVSLKLPTVAIIVVDPAPTVVRRPELSMVAVDVDDEFHVTPDVRSALDPSL